MMIRQLLPGDDLKTAARLIYDTDSKGFARMFGPREKAVSSIEKLIQLDSNHFSHRFIWVWCDDAVRALMIVFTREEMRHSLKSTDYLACFSPVELAALAFRQARYRVPVSYKNEEAYIQNICVAPQDRNRGIGSEMLNHCFERLKSMGKTTVSLDVGTTNQGARRLYEKLGFQTVGNKKRNAHSVHMRKQLA
ncbi:MAG TPA: N-acetyltransferase [Clostridiales bacterium]|nr:N-acetyltransferase [Clostridiales bacterium]HQH62580.1 N-acetyltransferase [Clostridiales bacterium]HQK74254.1 N-acetyltransferase [Clostridiales bacterium]